MSFLRFFDTLFNVTFKKSLNRFSFSASLTTNPHFYSHSFDSCMQTHRVRTLCCDPHLSFQLTLGWPGWGIFSGLYFGRMIYLSLIFHQKSPLKIPSLFKCFITASWSRGVRACDSVVVSRGTTSSVARAVCAKIVGFWLKAPFLA